MLDFLFDLGEGGFSVGKFSKGLISKNHFGLGIRNGSWGLGSRIHWSTHYKLLSLS